MPLYLTHIFDQYEIPDTSNEPRTIYQLISDELALDGRGVQNMASFVSTWMEPEAEKLITENLFKNLADKDEYPQMVEIQDRCVHMIASLFNAPPNSHATGTSCVGSSEALMLSCLSHKFNWRNQRKKEGKDVSKPNMVFGNNAQVTELFIVFFKLKFFSGCYREILPLLRCGTQNGPGN